MSRRILLICFFLTTLPMLLRAQEPQSMTLDELNLIYMDFGIALQLWREGQIILNQELPGLKSDLEKLRNQQQKSEESQTQLKNTLNESKKEVKSLQEDLKSANQRTDDLENSFNDYQKQVKKETEIAFKALQGQIDTYQMLFYGFAGGVLGWISGHNLNGPVGGLIGVGAGVGAGIVIAIIL